MWHSRHFRASQRRIYRRAGGGDLPLCAGQLEGDVGPDGELRPGMGRLEAAQPEQSSMAGWGSWCYSDQQRAVEGISGRTSGAVLQGRPGVQRGGRPDDVRYDHFAPRLGFAWSPSRGPSAAAGQRRVARFFDSRRIRPVLQPRPGRAVAAEPGEPAGVLYLARRGGLWRQPGICESRMRTWRAVVRRRIHFRSRRRLRERQ